MGIKPVYKLTTEDGRTIKTTGNHPYLRKNLARNAFSSRRLLTENQSYQGKENRQNNQKSSSTSRNLINIHYFSPFFSNITAINRLVNPANNKTENFSNAICISNPNIPGSSHAPKEPITAACDNSLQNEASIRNWAEDKLGFAINITPNNLAINNNLSQDQNDVKQREWPARHNAKLWAWTKVIHLSPGDKIAVADSLNPTPGFYLGNMNYFPDLSTLSYFENR